MVTIYYRKKQFKIRKCDRHRGEIPGDQTPASSCPGSSMDSIFFFQRRCSTRGTLSAGETHLRLHVQGFIGGQSHGHGTPMADLTQLPAPPKMNSSCVVRGLHHSSLPAQLSGVAQDPSEQRRSQEAGWSGFRGSLSRASQGPALSLECTGQSLGNPSLHTYLSYSQFEGPGLNFTGDCSFLIQTTINLPCHTLHFIISNKLLFFCCSIQREGNILSVFYHTYFLLI